MVGKTKAPTVVEKKRMSMLSESGCICCLLASGKTGQAEVHHLTSAGRRRGHMFTLALCVFHHRGLVPEFHNRQTASGLMGPSFAHGRRGFQEFFGSDDLLLKIQNLILEYFNESPWFDYIVPPDVKREARELWGER